MNLGLPGKVAITKKKPGGLGGARQRCVGRHKKVTVHGRISGEPMLGPTETSCKRLDEAEPKKPEPERCTGGRTGLQCQLSPASDLT